MSEILFQDPPETRGGRRGQHDHAGISRALRARPGEWALVLTDAASATATAIKSGALKHYRPAGAFEATVRGAGLSGRAAEVYARYVGGES